MTRTFREFDLDVEEDRSDVQKIFHEATVIKWEVHTYEATVKKEGKGVLMTFVKIYIEWEEPDGAPVG